MGLLKPFRPYYSFTILKQPSDQDFNSDLKAFTRFVDEFNDKEMVKNLFPCFIKFFIDSILHFFKFELEIDYPELELSEIPNDKSYKEESLKLESEDFKKELLLKFKQMSDDEIKKNISKKWIRLKHKLSYFKHRTLH